MFWIFKLRENSLLSNMKDKDIYYAKNNKKAEGLKAQLSMG